MANKDLGDLYEAVEKIKARDLAEALRLAEKFETNHPELQKTDEIDEIYDDFHRMVDYMRRGYSDPSREELYDVLLKRAFTAVCNLRCAYRNMHDELFVSAAARIRNRTFDNDTVRRQLENFVTEEAMLGLESDEIAKNKEPALCSAHYEYVSAVFDNILLSGRWKADEALFYESLVLSPTIDADDALIIVSAISLACLSVFDINKFACLVNIYKAAGTKVLRQRAFVGWVFCMSDETDVFCEQETIVRDVCAREGTLRQLVDMQKQVDYCMSAERDHETIQRDIMPTLIKNNNFSITRNGIIEKDEDPMDDILGREDADKRMEAMEESIRNMMNMQRSGSDIYFGGFSQMKRFPFFYKLVNWFMPFTSRHPDLRRTVEKMGKSKFLQSLSESGPFCESDKYSLALAMSTVIGNIPAGMREMLDNQELAFPAADGLELDDESYVRRMYLQDLYRFFRLYPRANGIDNPFGTRRSLFVLNKALRGTSVADMCNDLCMFYHKRGNGDAMRRMLEAYRNNDDAASMLLSGIYEMYYGGGGRKALPYLERSLELDPDNRRAKVMTGRACLEDGEYDRAAAVYGELHAACPENKGYLLNYALAHVKGGKYDDAEKLLYKLEFDFPDDINITRMLAWTHLGQRKTDVADKEYARIMKHPDSNVNDILNDGYCKWFGGDIAAAVDRFKTFTSSSEKVRLQAEFENDIDMLLGNGITETDIRLMEYAVSLP